MQSRGTQSSSAVSLASCPNRLRVTHASGHPALGRDQLPCAGSRGLGRKAQESQQPFWQFFVPLLYSYLHCIFSYSADTNSQSAATFSLEDFLPGQAWAAHLSFACLSPPTYLLQGVCVHCVTCTGQGCVQDWNMQVSGQTANFPPYAGVFSDIVYKSV